MAGDDGLGTRPSERERSPRTVLFVCVHGALRSRLAEAFFNAAAPPGWRATSAGLDPQEAVSALALSLVAGTSAAATLDRSSPRKTAAAGSVARIVAIDCELPRAEIWDLDQRDAGPAMRDEIAERVRALAAELARADTVPALADGAPPPSIRPTTKK